MNIYMLCKILWTIGGLGVGGEIKYKGAGGKKGRGKRETFHQ